MNQVGFNTKSKKGKHLCLWERKEIENALRRGASVRSIAKALDRPPSTAEKLGAGQYYSARQRDMFLPTLEIRLYGKQDLICENIKNCKRVKEKKCCKKRKI